MSTTAQPSRTCTFRRAGVDLTIALLPLLGATFLTWWLLALPATFLLHTGALYALLGTLILLRVPAALPAPGLGPANRVTLARASLALPVIALVLHPDALGEAGRWWIIVVCTVVMTLDGLDGWVARRTESETAFGGAFDMELDAFLILALSVLVWLSGRVGAWVVLIGVLRYLFMAAGWVWPRLRAELPASQRRKTVCVVQGIVLLVCLGPIVPSDLASVLAGVALTALLYSFVVDTWWLTVGGSAGRPDGIPTRG